MTIVWNAQRVSEGLKEIDTARPLVLLSVKNLLNEYHKVNESSRYYDILLGDWVERYLHLVYVASQQLASGAVEKNQLSDLTTIVKISVLSDTAEFFAAHQTLPEEALSVLTALTFYGTDSLKISDGQSVVRDSSSSGRRDKLTTKLLKLISLGTNPKVLFVKPFSGSVPKTWIAAMFSWRKWASHDDLQIRYSVKADIDAGWRSKNLSAVNANSSLADLANSMLTAFIPVCAVEALNAITTQVIAARPNRFDHIYSSQALWTHFAFKLLAAQWCEQGSKLHYHQHGGWYGLDESHVGEEYESRVADHYYTWGWSRDASNTKQLPPVTRNLPKQDKVFDSLICFDQPKNIYRLQYFPLPGTLQTMYEQTAEFVKNRESLRPLKIRLFPGEFGLTQQSAITEARPDAVFDNSTPIFSQYSESQIVVHNYVGTSWLETIGNNIPTVCFYDIDAYRFRSDAKSLLEDLVDVGILHLSGISAAEHVNKIDGDVNGWWLQENVQRARKNFAREYANYTSDWKQIWQENFLELLNN